MTAFNPPPGWPVKPGFTPVPDWSPDPSWPAAPTGWRFWVDEPEVVPVEIDDETFKTVSIQRVDREHMDGR